MKKDVEVYLKEKRIFSPSKELVENSNVKKWMDKQNIKDYDALLKKSQDIEWFWGEVAKDLISIGDYEKVLDWKLPYAKWFTGAKYNIVQDALDRHKDSDKIAYIFEGEPGEVENTTYKQLYGEVCKLANALKELGVKKGERVGIYLPMIVQLPVAMLACAKIGAIHSVVFSGFSAKAFQDRMIDCEAKVVITCDSFYRNGKTVPLKKQTDEALEKVDCVEKVIVYQRTKEEVSWNKNKDLWWHDFVEKQEMECETEKTDANDTLFFLYTSGTTGKPKGIIHAHAGYALGISLTLKWVFDLKENDVWWCAADIGWITGHSYIVYAPLILGVTSLMYEGAPVCPQPDRWWELIAKHKVSVLYTSPTAIRLFTRYGEEYPQKHDLSSLRLLGSVGEPINPEAWMWYYKYIGNEKCQIMDTWWQTETGSHVIAPLPITDLKPGSATKPLPGFSAAIFNEKGKEVENGGGNLVLLKPWPGMLRGIYKEPERYQKTYWDQFKNVYSAGDIARQDKDGYFWIQGRSDDVLSVAGHRVGNSEIESALVSHPSVAEAAVIGKPHPIKGESITAYVIVKKGIKLNDALKEELRNHVAEEIGKIVKPQEVLFVSDLPKTRSGKIMRRIIKAKALGEEVGDLSTLANPEAVEEIGNAK
ncbi:acetate--CoA ligase [Candidatus Woesearchaeota archaeon]|jgi:acetyl-CoA synthetase|nr:acetate--CoA ligase [Candidatus Woesearchaeota archaeon]MBT5343233.1 acetate--CoA ligase [Candidatus Woesearchaeota archaeon]